VYIKTSNRERERRLVLLFPGWGKIDSEDSRLHKNRRHHGSIDRLIIDWREHSASCGQERRWGKGRGEIENIHPVGALASVCLFTCVYENM
jgi:hypothetical protein